MLVPSSLAARLPVRCTCSPAVLACRFGTLPRTCFPLYTQLLCTHFAALTCTQQRFAATRFVEPVRGTSSLTSPAGGLPFFQLIGFVDGSHFHSPAGGFHGLRVVVDVDGFCVFALAGGFHCFRCGDVALNVLGCCAFV